MLEKCRPSVKAAMSSILDTFCGADGGISYTQLCVLVEGLDCKAQEGGADAQAAERLVSIVLDFNKLIKVAKERV